MAVGNEVKDMIGQTPDFIIASRPLKDEVIANYKTTETIIKYFFSPYIVISIKKILINIDITKDFQRWGLGSF